MNLKQHNIMSDIPTQPTDYPAATSPWIPVSLRLPDPGRLVLVAQESNPPPTIAYLESDGRHFYDAHYGWVEATHWAEVWMPDGKPLPLQEEL